jgi:hypothetical protein
MPDNVVWHSSDEQVAIVTGGLVRAVGGGEARIVASWGAYQSSAVVSVVGPAKKHDHAVACLKRTQRAGQLMMAQCS